MGNFLLIFVYEAYFSKVTMELASGSISLDQCINWFKINIEEI